MSDTSTKLGLMLPTQVDPFSTADVRANFEKIDAAPGTHICTSSTTPSWTSAQAGRRIYQTDVGLEWIWTGSAWKRAAAQGLLKNSGGGWASVSAGQGSWGGTTYAMHLILGSVGVPSGARPIKIEAQFGGMQSNPGNYVHVGLAFGATNNSGIAAELRTGASTATVYGSGGYISIIYEGGLPAGYYSWSLQYRASSGAVATIANARMMAIEL